MLKPLLESLKERSIIPSEQQTAVLNWVLNQTGSLELLARAGCGKTFTLLLVVRAIIMAGLGDIAIMAYNRKIADEIKGKLEAEGYDWKQAEANTVHGFGNRAWRKMAPNAKLEPKKVQNIIEALAITEQERAGQFIRANRATIGKLVSLAKQKALGHLKSIDDTQAWRDIFDHFGLEEDLGEHTHPEEIIAVAVKVYRLSLEQCHTVIDYDDMILAPLYFRARFWPKKWILVDESQDTNDARRALALAMLAPKVGRMIFVGDDRQAIYGFTGADADSMAQLRGATGAVTLPLNVTRRCPKSVVRQAQRLVPDFTAHDEAPEGIVRSLRAHDDLYGEGLKHGDAVLCRNTAPLVSLAFALLAKGIACRVEGRDIGEGLIKLARRWKVKELSALLSRLEDYEARQKAKYMSREQEDRIQALEDQVDCLRVIIHRCLLAKRALVEDLVREINGMFGDSEEKGAAPVAVLSTVHKSKGREWQRVFILGRRKYMPSKYAKKPWQQEQERNLEYVAITRAMHELVDVPAASNDQKGVR